MAALWWSPMSDNRDKVRTFRVPADEWRAAREVADSRGESLSQVIREALRKYVMRHQPKP